MSVVDRSFSDRTSLTVIRAVNDAKEGHTSAWRDQLAIYVPALKRLLIRRCRHFGYRHDDELLDRVLVETFIKVWRNIGTFEFQNDNRGLHAWIQTIADREFINVFRKDDRIVEQRASGGTTANRQIQAANQDGSSDSECSEYARLIWERSHVIAKDRFAPQVWQSAILTIVHGHNASEAAEILGLTPAAVRQNKGRVLKTLREMMGPLADRFDRSSDREEEA